MRLGACLLASHAAVPIDVIRVILEATWADPWDDFSESAVEHWKVLRTALYVDRCWHDAAWPMFEALLPSERRAIEWLRMATERGELADRGRRISTLVLYEEEFDGNDLSWEATRTVVDACVAIKTIRAWNGAPFYFTTGLSTLRSLRLHFVGDDMLLYDVPDCPLQHLRIDDFRMEDHYLDDECVTMSAMLSDAACVSLRSLDLRIDYALTVSLVPFLVQLSDLLDLTLRGLCAEKISVAFGGAHGQCPTVSELTFYLEYRFDGPDAFNAVCDGIMPPRRCSSARVR